MPPKAQVDTTILDDSPVAVQQRANTASIADFELPKTTLAKLAKGSIPDNVKMQQEVVVALMRSSTLFISYLTAAAHDQALARSGKSITASDVIKAITELDFGPADDLVPVMERELAAFRANNQASKASKTTKPPGPGKGRPRKSNATVDVDMSGNGDDDEGPGTSVVDNEGSAPSEDRHDGDSFPS